MTNQEAFDKVCRHLLRPDFKQSRKSDNSGYCAYAGPDGNSCAIGCLLPRELGERLDRLDGAGWSTIAVSQGLAQREAASILFDVDNSLLIDLQMCHDRANCGSADGYRASRETRLRRIAEDFTLNFREQV